MSMTIGSHTSRCPKCGVMGRPRVNYHRKDCRALRRSPCRDFSDNGIRVGVDHLVLTCTTCGFQEARRTEDSP